MQDNLNLQVNELLNIMFEATQDTSDYVFLAYSMKKITKSKPIFNLFAESFIGIKSFCLLMMNKAWAQAAIILRTLLEQVSPLFIISL